MPLQGRGVRSVKQVVWRPNICLVQGSVMRTTDALGEVDLSGHGMNADQVGVEQSVQVSAKEQPVLQVVRAFGAVRINMRRLQG